MRLPTAWAPGASSISMQFKGNEHVRVAFVVEKRSENRLIYCYIWGLPGSLGELEHGADAVPVVGVKTILTRRRRVQLYKSCTYDFCEFDESISLDIFVRLM